MIVNSTVLLEAAPIKNMLSHKVSHNGVSHGMSEAGYDIRIKQGIHFIRDYEGDWQVVRTCPVGEIQLIEHHIKFVLASSMEEFQMPDNLIGIVHDKSTWARKGLSVFNTVIESGWNGFLTLELVYHGRDSLYIPAGSGIAQVIFHEAAVRATYTGKYQNQEDKPVEAIKST